MGSSPGRPTGVRVYVSDHERRRRVRRRRLVLLGAVAVVALAAVAGARALTRGAGSPSPGAGAAARPGAAAHTPSARPSASGGAASSAALASRVITIGWVGDTTPGSMYGMPPDDGRALFGSLRPLLSAPDLMIANLEGTYSTAGPSKCGASTTNCYAFQAPPSYAAALAWSGIDLVNMANNHSMDYLARGFAQTKAALKRAGIAYAGPPDTVTIVRVRGLRVAVAGFSPYPWSAPLNDIPAAARLVRRAAAEADIVVVLMHAGAEGAGEIHTPHGSESAFGEDRGNARAFSHAMIDAGADLVLGSGPHVIRGIERYRDHLIAYSLGNFAGWHNFGLGGNLSLSGLLTVRIDGAGRIVGGRWLSLYVASPGVPTLDSSDASAHLVSSLSATDFARTYRLDSRGYFTGR